MTRIGSLCSGYGGLEMAVQAVLCGTVAWHCENDPDATKVLTHHWPHVPNHDDLTEVDWATVEPVDILTAGFPCQPVSHAGKRKGTDDDRWLFDDICAAISRMGARPGMLLLENVPGLLSANGGHAMARVVHGLAALGYVGSWRTVRACDAGAPHQRKRWFCVAADARCINPGESKPRSTRDSYTPGELARPHPLAADTAHLGHERAGRTRDRWAGSADSGQPATDPTGNPGRLSDGDGGTPTDPTLTERRGPQQQDLASPVGRTTEPRERPSETAWGAYAPAIRRWEHTLDRRAPAPTEPGRTGQRLNPAFVEWMMGLPAGYVTAVPGLTRNAQLRILGNGVVPQQAAAALRALLNNTQAGAA